MTFPAASCAPAVPARAGSSEASAFAPIRFNDEGSNGWTSPPNGFLCIDLHKPSDIDALACLVQSRASVLLSCEDIPPMLRAEAKSRRSCSISKNAAVLARRITEWSNESSTRMVPPHLYHGKKLVTYKGNS